MTRKEYADFLLPNIIHDVEYYEKKYPERDLKEGAIVKACAIEGVKLVVEKTIDYGNI